MLNLEMFVYFNVFQDRTSNSSVAVGTRRSAVGTTSDDSSSSDEEEMMETSETCLDNRKKAANKSPDQTSIEKPKAPYNVIDDINKSTYHLANIWYSCIHDYIHCFEIVLCCSHICCF